jgi:hypothetical protein
MILVRLSNKWSWYVSQTNGLGTSLKQMVLVRLSNKWSWYVSQTNGLGTSLKQMVLVHLSNKWSWYVSQTNGLGTSLKQHLKTHFGEFLTFLLWYIKVVCSFFGNHKSDVIHVLKCVWQDVLIGSKIWCFYVGSIIMGLKRNIYVEWECKIDMYGMWNITMFIHKFLEHTGVE